MFLIAICVIELLTICHVTTKQSKNEVESLQFWHGGWNSVYYLKKSQEENFIPVKTVNAHSMNFQDAQYLELDWQAKFNSL